MEDNFCTRHIRFWTIRAHLITSNLSNLPSDGVPLTATNHMAARDNDLFGTPLAYHYKMAQAHSTQDRKPRRATTFDTDSFSIKIDNCCSKCMSGKLQDFIPGSLCSIRPKLVIGYESSHSYITQVGTIQWNVVVDIGVTRQLTIPESLFNPTNKARLLSPQHLAQHMQPFEKKPGGTLCRTFADLIELLWNDRQHQITNALDPDPSNIATIYAVHGLSKYHAYCSVIHEPHEIAACRVELPAPNPRHMNH
jgi:hypothetical protein